MSTRIRSPRSAAAPTAPEERKPRPRRTRSESHDGISAEKAAALVGRTYPTQFNQERERRQLVLDPVQGLLAYPEELLGSHATDAVREAKARYDRSHHLVVIEWGGSKPPGRAWEYSRRQCEAVQQRGLLAELEARRAWGLPTVSASLRGVKAPRSRRDVSGRDQESASGPRERCPGSGERP